MQRRSEVMRTLIVSTQQKGVRLMMVHGNRRQDVGGQSTLEYILVIAAILAAIIAVAGTLLGPAVNKTMTDSKKIIEDSSGKLQTGLGL